MTLAIALAVAYLLGSIPTSYIVVHLMTGRDVRSIGNGNPGMMNVWDNVGLRPAVLVGLGDVGKGMAAVSVAYWLGFGDTLAVACGLVAVAGHDFSIFLRLHGGNGTAAAVGALLALVPEATLPATGLAVVLYVVTRSKRLAGITGLLAVPVLAFAQTYPDVKVLGTVLLLSVVAAKIIQFEGFSTSGLGRRGSVLTFDDVVEEFREAVSGPADEVPLARAALIAARAEYPELDLDAHERRLQDMADTLEHQLSKSGVREHPRRTVMVVNQLMYRELGFRGNTDAYDDPRNLFLNYVLAERRGIPVTLAIVYSEVCQRVGLDVRPVGLPGHVVCRYRPADDMNEGVSADGDELLLDVFSGGRLMTERDCQTLIRNIFGARMAFKQHYLSPLMPRQVLQRLLHNLKAGYLQRGDEDRAAKVIDLLLALFPWDLDEIRDRGMLRERLGEVSSALTDLEQYVQFRPGARDIQTVTETVRSLRRHVRGRQGEA